jgi:hypothetical protein
MEKHNNDCNNTLTCFNDGDNLVTIKADESKVDPYYKQNIEADNTCEDVDGSSPCSNNLGNTANIHASNGG